MVKTFLNNVFHFNAYKPSNIIKIFFINLLYLITSINCYIKLPVKYYPVKIFNETNPSNTMHNLVIQRLYATMELGTPKQTIQIPIEFETSDFYISKYDTKIYDQKYNLFKFNHFNEKSSNTISYIETDDNLYYGVNFFIASTAKDYFYFEGKKTQIEFYLAEHLTETMPGELGLQIYPITDLNTAFDSIEKSFMKKIKNSGMINNYVWSILYKKTNNNNFNTKENDAYLYIGDYLHEIDKKDLINDKIYDNDKLTSINAYIYQNIVKGEFEMNKLIIYRNNNPLDIIKEIELKRNYLRIKLDHNFAGIQGSEIIRPFLEENLFTKSNNCNKDTFSYKGKFYFYYCKNNPTTIKNIKSKFPTLQFTHQDFNFNFTIKGDDLFVENGDYVYCLMIFEDYKKYEWRLGRPFLNKYTFMTDQDGKKILFYSIDDEVTYRGLKTATLIIIIFFLVIIFSFLGFLLGRKIYRIRVKRHANVLEDDFEYTPPELKYKKGSKIEMSNKLYS